MSDFWQADPVASGLPNRPSPPARLSAPNSMALDVLNTLPAAEQGSTPNVSAYGDPISTDVYQNDAGEIQYKDPATGKLVTTDSAKQVVLRDPSDGMLKVYARTPQTNEGPVTGVSRVLSMGLGASEPGQTVSSALPLEKLGNAPRAVPDAAKIKEAATSVYNDPTVRGTKIPPAPVAKIARDMRQQLTRSGFHPSVQGEKPLFDILGDIAKTGASRDASGKGMAWPTINDLDILSQRLGHIADQTEMKTNGVVAPTKAAAAAVQVKSQVDDLLRRFSPQWQTADANYASAATSNALDKKAAKAQILAEGGGKDYLGRLRSTATQLLANPSRTRGMTPDEIAKLKQISQGTSTQNALDWLSNKLGNRISYGIGSLAGGAAGFAHAGPEGGIGGMLLGGAADAAAQKMITGLRNVLAGRQINQLTRLVRSRSPLGQQMAKAALDYQVAYKAMSKAPTTAKFTALSNAARILSDKLAQAGVALEPRLLAPADQTQGTASPTGSSP